MSKKYLSAVAVNEAMATLLDRLLELECDARDEQDDAVVFRAEQVRRALIRAGVGALTQVVFFEEYVGGPDAARIRERYGADAAESAARKAALEESGKYEG